MASYAIISVGGKQYRVREGERLLVDRVAAEDGATFSPTVLLVGGDGEPSLSPKGVAVTARVVAQERGPKIRIGKYRKRTGYRRHTGFRAALTRIEIEAIGSGKAAAAKPRAEAAEQTERAKPEQPAEAPAGGALPAGYDELTVVEVKAAAGSWTPEEVRAALDHERAHSARKGAIAALESALAENEKER
jgi:large subunit ribosomal protein L21